MTQDMSKDNKKQHSSQCEVRNRRTVSPSAANSLFHSRELRLCFNESHSLLASLCRYAAVVLLMMVGRLRSVFFFSQTFGHYIEMQ
jgi:hypothetical protein